MKERLNIEGFADIPGEIRVRFIAELDEQAQDGFKPRVIIIDRGKGAQTIAAIDTRAQAFYGDVDLAKLTKATQLAWDMLTRQTRVKTGAARASFRLYFRGREVGGRGDIDRIARAMTDRDVMVIMGPTVPYGRKLYWRPAGPSRVIKRTHRAKVRTRDRSGTVSVKFSTSYTEPMFRAVKRLLRRRYPDLYSDDGWRDYGAGGSGRRWPALAIGGRGNPRT